VPDVRVDAYEHADDLPEGLFGRLQVAGAYTCPAELVRLERAQPLPVAYLVATTAGGEPLAFLPVYVAVDGVSRECDPVQVFGAPMAAGRPTVLLGAPGGYLNHLSVGRDLSADRAAAGVRSVLTAALRLVRDRRPAAVVVPHLLDWQRELVTRGGPPASAGQVDHRAVLDLAGPGFDGYLARLPHRRRADVRAERDRFLRSGRVIREAPLWEVLDQAAPLVAAVEARYGRTYGAGQMAWYLASTAAAMGEQGTALLLEVDDQLVGVTSLWRAGAEWHVRAWGCDYAALGRDASYFGMTIYEPVVRAAAAGACRLHLGPGALAAKTRRGARLEALHSVLLAAA
jgi:hypothetical protein